MIGSTHPPCDRGIATSAGGTGSTDKRIRKLTLAATILGSSMAFIDGSVVNVALPAISRALTADATATGWVVNAYLLLLGSLVLAGGSLADRYGRRRIFMIGVAVFTAASVACGLAPSMPWLILGRAAQGAGAALLTPASLALLGAAYPPESRGKAIGLWAGFGALTMAAGPVFGGWLVDTVSWRAIFLINVPLAIGALLLARAANESRDPATHPLDLPGIATVVAGLAVLTWAVGAGPRQGWLGAPGLGVAAGLVLLGLFVWIEARRGDRAMMPLALFKVRAFAATNALTLMLYFALGGALYFLPFGLIRIGGYSATQAGAALLPFALVMGFGSPLAGALADRWGARLSLGIGPLVAAGGLAWLGATDLGGAYWTALLPALLLLAAGLTMTVAPLTATVMSAVGDEHAGTASGINNAVARVAGLFAVALLGVVFAMTFSGALPAADAKTAGATLDAVMAGRASGGEGSAAFAHALSIVMYAAAGCAAVGGTIAGVMLRNSSGPAVVPPAPKRI
ncbi:DHA2 family efflux MFS transporter permease subunit [Sphingosinicellaceae bacterium]|nr:DHA2 family efflux MFS transporter permease subunit [Sphingosinicellaceae bacterium]